MIKKCITCGRDFKITGIRNIQKRINCSLRCGKIFKSIKYCGEGNPFYGKKHSIKTSKKMSESRKIFFESGGKSPSWKGGQRIGSDGYVLIHSPYHPFKDSHGYVREHRLIIEKHINRLLKKIESVHHVDKNKINNSINNLIAFTSESAHQRFHFSPSNIKPEEIIFDGRYLK